MCMPLGPKWRGMPGRAAFKDISDCSRRMSSAAAAEKYPDKSKALKKIENFVSKNVEHTEKWIIDGVYHLDGALARIYADNYEEIHKFYLAKRREWKKAQA